MGWLLCQWEGRCCGVRCDLRAHPRATRHVMLAISSASPLSPTLQPESICFQSVCLSDTAGILPEPKWTWLKCCLAFFYHLEQSPSCLSFFQRRSVVSWWASARIRPASVPPAGCVPPTGCVHRVLVGLGRSEKRKSHLALKELTYLYQNALNSATHIKRHFTYNLGSTGIMNSSKNMSRAYMCQAPCAEIFASLILTRVPSLYKSFTELL